MESDVESCLPKLFRPSHGFNSFSSAAIGRWGGISRGSISVARYRQDNRRGGHSF